MCAAAMQHVFALANHVTALLNGATDPDPSQHGMTTEEERASSSKPQVRKQLYYIAVGLGVCMPLRQVLAVIVPFICHAIFMATANRGP